MAAAAAACGGDGSRVIRIYVGGLSASVTAADMEKTFSSLGRVTAVDFVRNNGRSFAFMDFQPSSDKSLAKLLSTYNGCTWKGGKLKLEKAKEHYLARLKREWAEDAKHVPSTEVDPITEKNVGHLKISERLNQEKLQLRIFFPKLRKVKVLPFKGTGKHKYSFQRIEVPPLPIHFCDCEEHYDPSETASQNCSNYLDKVLHERELSIMSRVINRILRKEDNEIAGEKITEADTDIRSEEEAAAAAAEAEAAAAAVEEEEAAAAEEEEAEEASDADNIVINIGTRTVDDILMQYKGGGTLSLDKETRNAKDESTDQHKSSSRRRQKTAVPPNVLQLMSNESVHPILADKIDGDESTAPISPQELEMIEEAPPVPNITSVQSKIGNSWLQKASWKDLVGDSSFSISNVLRGIDAMGPELAKAGNSATTISPGAKKRRVEANPVYVQNIPLEKKAAVEPRPMEESEGDLRIGEKQDEFGQRRESRENGNQEPKRKIPKVGISEVCTFMRSAESEMEWAKAKAALTGYKNKKSSSSSTERDISRSLKSMQSRKR